ncbi:uncharacterized protein C19orf44 homolog [Megalops cyprinoides]|uniref:uncharacterized protein C19orf44 homolog n=1 Tax=Megalops cyprinoides TaxID=118141 RepID=UPI0018648C8F|nr:uncharacterized protein C19orf44 homolog [Megalops cyprinoides]
MCFVLNSLIVFQRSGLTMWSRSEARSSALERAQAQLSGRRVSILEDSKRDELQARQIFQDLSDLSSDDKENEYDKGGAGTAEGRPILESPPERKKGGEGSRFLKKVPVTSSQSPAPSKVNVQKEESRIVSSSQRSSQSAALSRLALIEDRFRSRKQAKEGQGTELPAPDETPLSTRSSSELSMKGSRFLKKKSTPLMQQQNPEPVKADGYRASQFKSVGKGVSLDSDEEDMKKLLEDPLESSDESLHKERGVYSQDSPGPVRKSFVKSRQKFLPSPPLHTGRRTPSSAKSKSPSPPRRGGFRAQAQSSPSFSVKSASMAFSPTPSPPTIPSPGRTVSPRAKFLRPSLSSVSAHSEVRSLAELFVDAPPSDNTISEKSEASDEFKINILSLDDLVPDTSRAIEKSVQKKTKSKVDSVKQTRSLSHSLNVVLAEDILSEEEIVASEVKAEYESDFESEIKTETDQSASEISERLGQRNKDASTSSEVQDYDSGRDDVSDPSERRSGTERSVSYSTRSESASSNESRSSRRGSHSRSSTSASNTITPPRERRRTRREAAVQTQRDGLSYTWSTGMAALGPPIGMSHVDPTPIASHVVSAEAVEALTAYSPAVFALNDMLRQQLALTRQIMETSRHLHSSLLESLGPANYHYTTLEDTKEFIRSHKSSKLTMEEALEEVLQEMREYHYL